MSFYHHRPDDPNNNISGKAIHLLHHYEPAKVKCQAVQPDREKTILGICWRVEENSLIELAIFGLFFLWYFRIRSKAIMERNKDAKDFSRVITNIYWEWLGKM
ncbi:MAG: hypothetical protein AAB867_03300 [Patescibacteria group bacterium]